MAILNIYTLKYHTRGFIHDTLFSQKLRDSWKFIALRELQCIWRNVLSAIKEVSGILNVNDQLATNL